MPPSSLTSQYSLYHLGIVFLAMGGIGLGKAVLSSGLLDDMYVLALRLSDIS